MVVESLGYWISFYKEKNPDKEPSVLFLDDIRKSPVSERVTVVRSYSQMIHKFRKVGCPNIISFDHDLGTELSGFDVAKYMVNRDLDMNGGFIPDCFMFLVHSANPVGAKNIDGLLSNYLKESGKSSYFLEERTNFVRK